MTDTELDKVQELVQLYKQLPPENVEDAKKIQRILMLLMEFSQLDIILHVLDDAVFLDALDIFDGTLGLILDMQRDKAPGIGYREYFVNRTKFLNPYNFPPSIVQIIKDRYKLIFLKDYIFCSHQTEEFLNYLNSIIEIPNSSIFLYLAEYNDVFAQVLDDLGWQSNQFFNEFFAIYKSLTNDSKVLFGVTFFLKKLHEKYIEKIFCLLKYEDSAGKSQILNLVELLGILVTSKKDNALKIFGCKVELAIPGGQEKEKISFSHVLNLILLDNLEKVRDSGLNFISQMIETPPVQADRANHLTMLNSYLVPEMANYIHNHSNEDVSWHYYAIFLKLLSLCIDKEGTGTSNGYLLTSLVNYRVLSILPEVFKKFHRVKGFIVPFLQLVSALLCLKEYQVIAQMIDNKYLDLVCQCLIESSKKKTLVYSVCLRIFADLEKKKVPQYIDYIGRVLSDTLRTSGLAEQTLIRQILEDYRRTQAEGEDNRSIHGNFSVNTAQENTEEHPPFQIGDIVVVEVEEGNLGRRAPLESDITN